MRTTVTLDPDVDALIKRAMRERGLTFKQAVNEAIRTGEGVAPDEAPVTIRTHDMGRAKVDLTKSLQLAGQLEDEEIIRKLMQGK